MNKFSHLKFVKEWDENKTPIEWQRQGRRKLNFIIRAYNEWIKSRAMHAYEEEQAKNKLLINIEEGKQTWASVDGGEEWLKELENIENLINEI